MNELDSTCNAEIFHHLAVNILQRLDICDRNMLIDFVNGGVGGAQFDDLGADLGDEAAVAGAACGGQFGGDAGFAFYGIADGVDEAAFFLKHGGEEGQTADRPH
jgi:hypothetical protein